MLRRWSLAAIATIIVCGVLGVVWVTSTVCNGDGPMSRPIPIVGRPLDNQFEGTSSYATSKDLVIDPKPTVYDYVWSFRHFWSGNGHFLAGRNIDPSLLRLRFFPSKGDYFPSCASDVSEDHNDGFNIFSALYDYPWVGGHMRIMGRSAAMKALCASAECIAAMRA